MGWEGAAQRTQPRQIVRRCNQQAMQQNRESCVQQPTRLAPTPQDPHLYSSGLAWPACRQEQCTGQRHVTTQV